MPERIEVTFLANAGVLLQYNNVTLLIDGIQRSEGVPFSGLPLNIWETILERTPPFFKIDALLFTHLHPDHFSADMTEKYLRFYPNTKLLAPIEILDSEETRSIALLSQNSVFFSNSTDDEPYVLAPDVTVRAILTKHLGKRYENTKHFCYLISMGEKNLLFTSDVDYISETLSQVRNIPICAEFINPLFFHAITTKTFFRGQLSAENICIYHLPFENDDKWNMRNEAKKDRQAWRCANSEIFLFEEPMTKIIL